MFRQQSVDVHQFAMVPKADIPRSRFNMETAHKTAFDSGYLVPVYCDEVLPGDTFSVNMTAFARLATPLFPVMDNLHLDSFFFFVPNRLVWTNWVKFMGEQDSPGDSISYTVPQMVCPASGYAVGSLHDYFGLPTVGQLGGGATFSHSALFLRAYNLIYNAWFRDENLQNAVVVDKDDGPDTYSDYVLLRRGKRKDYFTSALPWPQKGTAVALPLGTSAPLTGTGNLTSFPATDLTVRTGAAGGGVVAAWSKNAGDSMLSDGGAATSLFGHTAAQTIPFSTIASGLVADLSAATAATVNQLRQSFQVQRLLERDARGGTRYTELVRAHFGVVSPDARLQRPEYLGGGSSLVNIAPVAQQSATGLTGGSTPIGNLAAFGTALAQHGFSQSFTEHGMVIGIVSVRADLSYQQGVRRMWSRSTRYDFYFPAFAMLGEQTILNQEIYCVGNGGAGDTLVFGYQERWAEYRYHPAMITGLFRSTAATTIDPWHLSQKFTALPTLNTTFIQDTPPLSRVLAVGAGANGQQLLFDSFIRIRAARPLPLYSVPGMIDHF